MASAISSGLVLFALVRACDASNNVSSVNLTTGTPGVFSVFTPPTDQEDDTRAVTVATQQMTEVDINGNPIPGGSGEIPTFETETFSATPVENATLDSVPAQKQTTQTIIPGVGTMELEFFNLEGAGQVGDESWDVYPGDTKFNVMLTSWNFSANAAFVDLSMKLGDGTPIVQLEEDVYDLGSRILRLTKTVYVDGAATTLPSGFPMLVNQSGVEVFSFRFPRFTSSLMYDPVIQGKGDQEVDPVDPNSTTTDSTTGSATGDDDGFTFVDGAGQIRLSFAVAILFFACSSSTVG